MKKTSKRTAVSRAPSPRPRRGSRRTGIAPKAAEPLLAFAAVAKREQLRWYLFGAQAVAAHGVARSTDDIDITVWLGERELAALVTPLRRAGFRPIIDDLAFAMETRVFPIHHVPEHLASLKVLAGRPKDLEDVRGLLRIDVLDHQRVLATLHLLERGLDQSDLVPLYKRLRRELKR